MVCRADEMVPLFIKEGIVVSEEQYLEIHEKACRKISRLKYCSWEQMQTIVQKAMKEVKGET